MPYLWADLRTKSDEELVAEHDRLAKTTVDSLDYFLDELARRENSRQYARIEALTNQMRWLTVAIGIMTLVVTVATVYGAIKPPG